MAMADGELRARARARVCVYVFCKLAADAARLEFIAGVLCLSHSPLPPPPYTHSLSPLFTRGLYTDEGSSNVILQNNVVYDTKDAGFHQHYGTDNVIINNIFAFPSSKYCSAKEAGEGQCDNSAIRSSQHMDCGLWEEGGSSGATPDYGCNSSFTFTRNIVLLGTQDVSGNATTHMHLTFVAYRHPEVNGLRNMTWGDNVYWSAPLGVGSTAALRFGTDFPPLNFSAWQTTFHDATSVVADPQFVDAQGKNFALLPGSPALAMGFQPIDLSTIGPRFPLRWKNAQ